MLVLQYLNDGFLAFLLSVIALVSAMFVAVPFHEFAHAAAARHEGDYTAVAYKRYTLAPHAHFDWRGFLLIFICGFGWAKPVPVDSRNFKRGRKSKFLVSIAGIVTNLLFAIVFLFVYMLIYRFFPNVYEVPVYGELLYYFLISSVRLNFGLAIFNLLPIYPLDGYKIVDSLSRYENQFLVFMKRYSFVIYIILIITGFYSMIYNYVVGNLLNILIKLFSKILGM